MIISDNVVKLFWKYIIKGEKEEDCWKWIGVKHRQGYGRISVEGNKKELAHRVSYNIFKGEIKDGLVLDHLCNNTECCNPEHLEAVTQKENVYRSTTITSLNAQKMFCPQNHPLFGDNLRIQKNGARTCILCIHQHAAKAYQKRMKKVRGKNALS